jgi:CcmD family protein
VTDKLPDNGGYVAAAYLVFLLLLLIYVAVMATRASRLERELGDVLDLVQREQAAEES